VSAYFLDEAPLNGYDLSTVFNSDTITPFDSIFLMVTDTLRGCFDYEPVGIVWNDVLFDISATLTACDTASGTAAVFNFSGVPASILWSNGSTTATVTDLPPGMIAVTVTSATGCSRMDSILISQNTFTIALTGIPEGCGNVNGIASVSFVSDTNDTYNYLWNTGDTVSQLTGLPGNNTYSVTVTNQDGCITADSIFVDSVNSVFDISIWSYEASCDTCGNGAIYVMVNTAPYGMTVVDSLTGDTLEFFNNYAPGTYTLIATDGIGCTNTYTIEVGWFFLNVFDYDLRDIGIFPNPIHNELHIESAVNIEELTIVGLDGRNLMTVQPESTKYTLDVSSLAKGVYTLVVNGDNKRKIIRLVRN